MEALPEEVDGLWVGFAFEGEDAGGEGVGGVVVEDGAAVLDEDGAGVVGVVGEVDGAAGDLAAVVEDGLVDVVAVHALAAEAGEEGGVDVEDFALVVGWDDQEAEEAGEADEVGVGVAGGVEDGVGEGVFVGVLLAGQDVDGEVELFGALDAEAGGVGGDDGGDVGVELAGLGAFVEVLQGGAAA